MASTNISIKFFLSGIGAVLMRQTNIVWTILVAIKCMDESLQSLLLTPSDCKKNVLSSWHQVPVNMNIFLLLDCSTREVLLTHFLGNNQFLRNKLFLGKSVV